MTADDFGAATAVNEAVEIAHHEGILTAASLMVAGDAAADAITRARAMPGLAIGLHIVLVDGRPMLPAHKVWALVGRDGRFHRSMLRTAFAIALFPWARRQMRAEVAAQFAAFAATGLPLDHANAHKHFHLHPMIAAAIIEAGAAHGLRAVRLPVEETSPALLRWWAARLGRKLRAAGLTVNARVVGLAFSGAFTARRMVWALAHLQAGLTEIYCHPASADSYPGSAPGYRYREELEALTAPAVKAQLTASGAICGGFAAFGCDPAPPETAATKALAA